jgi:hypothetical protein
MHSTFRLPNSRQSALHDNDGPPCGAGGVARTRKHFSVPQLPPPVRKAIEAANTADTAAFLALFEPGAGIVNDGGREFRGADAIRRWSDAQFAGSKVKINVVDFHLTDESETVVIADVADETSTGVATYTFGCRPGPADQVTDRRMKPPPAAHTAVPPERTEDP